MAHAQAGQLAAQAARASEEFMGLADGLRAHSENPPLNLLVVDDDEHIREVCRTVGAEAGMKPLDVSTAEEALELLELASVDILLTDLRLPGTSGLELL